MRVVCQYQSVPRARERAMRTKTPLPLLAGVLWMMLTLPVSVAGPNIALGVLTGFLLLFCSRRGYCPRLRSTGFPASS